MSDYFARRRLATALARAALLTLLLAPASALACPACIASDQKARVALPMVMGFLGVPFGIFGGAAVMIARRMRRERRTRAQGIPVAVGPAQLVYLAETSAADAAQRLNRPAA